MKYRFINIRVDLVANFGDKSIVIRTDFDRGGVWAIYVTPLYKLLGLYNRLPVLRLPLPYNLPPYFSLLHILLLISITYFYYLSPTKWRYLQWQLWFIVVIFLPPTSYIYRDFRATFIIKSLVYYLYCKAYINSRLALITI
jgi:hypothetical protein